jgi:hypothetical protein
MDLELSENFGNLIAVVLLLILPLLLLLIAAIVEFTNGVFYILTIFWFAMGIIFYGAIYSE